MVWPLAVNSSSIFFPKPLSILNVPDEVTGDSWHQTGLENGGTDCEDPPGTREGMGVKMYLAYLRDPSGNKICVLKRLA